jgi:hypothetical protein
MLEKLGYCLLGLVYYILFYWQRFFDRKQSSLDVFELADCPNDLEWEKEFLSEEKV